MKMFVFRDGLFCWVCAVVAHSVDEAVQLAHQAGEDVHNLAFPDSNPHDPYRGYTVEEIKIGLVIAGGGNG